MYENPFHRIIYLFQNINMAEESKCSTKTIIVTKQWLCADNAPIPKEVMEATAP